MTKILQAFALLLFASLLASSFSAGWFWQKAIARQKASELVAAAQAKELAQVKRMITDAERIAQNYQTRIDDLAADRSAANAAVIRLREVLASHEKLYSSPACRNTSSAISSSLAECAERYSELAGLTDQYANQLIALQDWARMVTAEASR